MELICFLNQYSSAIQAIVAIANLLIISFLTAKGFNLQKKLMQTEQFYKLQGEYDQCKNSISNIIQYFQLKSGTCSYYLKQLFDQNTGDGTSEELAKYSLENINKIIERLKKIKVQLEQYNENEIAKSFNAVQLQSKIKQLILLKQLLQNKNPAEFYEHTMYGPESYWLDDEQKFEEAKNGSKEMIDEISKFIEGLSK